jgi:D-amino-acid dehydrogenase
MTEAIIVGGGVIGLATAHRLARDGVSVTVIDAGGAESQTSVNNAGWLVPIMSAPVPAPGMVARSVRWLARKDGPLFVHPSVHPEHVRFMVRMLRHCNQRDFQHGLEALVTLNAHTMALFDGYEREGIPFEQHRTGQLMVFRTRAALRSYEAMAAAAERIGHLATRLSADEARDLEPALSPQIEAALHCPEERHVDPVTLVSGLAARCRALGVRFLHDIRVTDVHRGRHRATGVSVGGDVLRADVLVLAAGARTGALARAAGYPLPIQPGKGYGFDDTSGSVGLRHSVYLAEAKVAVTPLSDRLRFAGTMEFGTFDMGVDVRRLGGIVRSAHEYLPGFSATTRPKGWAGLRPMTPDGLPIIGRLPGTENVLVASGHCMLGVTLAPVTAAIIAGAVSGTGDLPDLERAAAPFSPARFSRRHR